MDKWVMCVVLFLLGMLSFHLLKGVCGCKNVVEGTSKTTTTTTTPHDVGKEWSNSALGKLINGNTMPCKEYLKKDDRKYGYIAKREPNICWTSGRHTNIPVNFVHHKLSHYKGCEQDNDNPLGQGYGWIEADHNDSDYCHLNAAQFIKVGTKKTAAKHWIDTPCCVTTTTPQ